MYLEITPLGISFTHYSEVPVPRLEVRAYHQEQRGVYSKPTGLWLSVDGEGDWKEWCESESFRLEGLAFAHRATLAPGSRVLMIGDLETFDAFRARYAASREMEISGIHMEEVRWGAVRREYQGIVIAPYQWRRRLSCDWYYPWDCASACIWDVSAIESWTLIGPAAVERSDSASL